MGRKILITGAGSGFGKAAAIGMAQEGHRVIATIQTSSQAWALREEAASIGLQDFVVERLDLQDPYDIEQAIQWDIDVLWNNAGKGEAGPVWEIPIELVRDNFEINVFLPLVLTQGFLRRWVGEGKTQGRKIVFTSSVVGLFTSAGVGIYAATKHALEAIAEALQMELAPYRIEVQTINPGAYRTGFNETMAETAFRWLDDDRNFTKREDLCQAFDAFFSMPEATLDPREMHDRLIALIPASGGKFRNVVPPMMEDILKAHQAAAWEKAV